MLAQVAQRWWCSISGDTRGQGWGSEHLVGLWVFLFTAGGGTRWPVRISSNSNSSMVLWFLFQSHVTKS